MNNVDDQNKMNKYEFKGMDVAQIRDTGLCMGCGICEGVFPNFQNEFNLLPMEQTFATIELMKASTNFFKKINHIRKEKISSNPEFKIEKENDLIYIFSEKEKILTFDYKNCKII